MERRTTWAAVVLFALFLALRIPFRSEFLVNWDAANFALALREFDLEHHQPHPPGYIGYVVLGRVLRAFTADANAALTWLSVTSGAAAPAGFLLLARSFVSRGPALASAVLLGLSPVLWYYSGVALTYALEMALVVFFLWLAYEARRRASLRHLAVATLLLVILGAVRQSGGLLMTPMWLYAAWAFPWGTRIGAAGALVAGNLAWLVPLVRLSGGPEAFYRASTELAGLAVAPTSVFALQPGGPGQNAAIVGAGLLLGLNAGLVVFAAGLLRSPGSLLRPFRGHGPFFLFWLLPVLGVYVLVHTGQLGYVLVLLPALFLLVAAAFESLAGGSAGRFTLPGAAGACAAVSVILFLSVGPALYEAARESGDPGAEIGPAAAVVAGLPLFRSAAREHGGLLDGVRQYDLRGNDRYWADLLELVEGHDPDRTRVLATPERIGSFRALAYYLPEHTVLGVGHDLDRDFGHLFTARGGTSDYTVAGLREASPVIRLPDRVEYLIAPDREVRKALEIPASLAGRVESESVRVGLGEEVLVLRIPRGTALRAAGGVDPFGDDDGGGGKPVLRLLP